MNEVKVRALQPDDAGVARVLVSRQLAGTLYESRILEQLEIAIAGDDPECRALVVIGPDGRGLALFGDVAGAAGVVKIHALAGDDRVVLQALARAVGDMGARMIVCEIADDAPFLVTAKALRELGYEEGRVADFVRDGVDLLILTWRSR